MKTKILTALVTSIVLAALACPVLASPIDRLVEGLPVARRVEEVGRMRDCPDRMAELDRRLRRDGIELARSKGGSLQYRFFSKALGAVRKVNGGRLGFAVDRSTGLVVRFTLRGIATAMRAFWELERKSWENQNGRGD